MVTQSPLDRNLAQPSKANGGEQQTRKMAQNPTKVVDTGPVQVEQSAAKLLCAWWKPFPGNVPFVQREILNMKREVAAKNEPISTSKPKSAKPRAHAATLLWHCWDDPGHGPPRGVQTTSRSLPDYCSWTTSLPEPLCPLLDGLWPPTSPGSSFQEVLPQFTSLCLSLPFSAHAFPVSCPQGVFLS